MPFSIIARNDNLETTIKQLIRPKLRNPVMVVGLPGIGNVGRVAAGYIASQLKMKKFAEVYSPHFLHLVLLDDDDIVRMLRCEFYYLKGKRDIIVLTGDTQSITTEGHYEFCEKILEYAKKLGVKEIITLGGFTENGGQQQRVIAAANSKETKKKYARFRLDFGEGHPVGTIMGASGLLVGMAENYKMHAMILMGETMGMPFIMDPKAADAVLHVLIKVLGVKLDLGKLENTVRQMEERLKRTEDIHKKLLQDIPKSKDDIRYIG